MNEATGRLPSRITPIALTWLALILLTLVSIALGRWMQGVSVLPMLVATIVWLKAWLVARYYLELRLSHTFIRWMVRVFIAFVPIALVITDLFGAQIAKWLTL